MFSMISQMANFSTSESALDIIYNRYKWGTSRARPHYFILDGIPIMVEKIGTDYQLKSAIKPYIRGKGSHAERTSEGGRLITIPIVVSGKNIRKIIRIKDKNQPVTLVSPSPAMINGYYIVIDFNHSEEDRGEFSGNISLQQYTPPKVSGNLVTANDLAYMSQPNMMKLGETEALEKFVLSKKDVMGRECRVRLKQFKNDWDKFLAHSPWCKKYLMGKQCQYLYKTVCGRDKVLFEHMYPRCKKLINIPGPKL